jgi:hypothetical protein
MHFLRRTAVLVVGLLAVSGTVSAQKKKRTPNLVLEVDPAAVQIGDKATVKWSSERITRLKLDDEKVGSSGQREVQPQATTTFSLEGKDPHGKAMTATATVTVRPKTPPPLAPPAIHVESTPPGARIQVGLKTVNEVVDNDSGRVVGVTPLTTQLLPSDVFPGDGLIPASSVTVLLLKPGYEPSLYIIGLGGRNAHLEDGKTYQVNIHLAKP